MKKSKQNYFTKFFENNLKNLKNTWKGINSLISIKSSSPYSPRLLTYQNETIDNTKRISNIFSNYFSTISGKTQEKIKHSHTNYSDYFTDENPDSCFLSPTDKKEVEFIIYSLDINKSNDPYSIPNKVLKMLKNDISEQLTILFNLFFSTGTFPTILKMAKVIPIYKKDSKLDFINYCPLSFLSNLDKILEKQMQSGLSTFLKVNDVIYPLQFCFRQNYST